MRDNIETATEVKHLFAGASTGNYDAEIFLRSADDYFASVKKLLPEAGKPLPQAEYIALLAQTNTLYTLPFYVRYATQLRVTMQLALASLLSGHGEPMAIVVPAIALITGGFANLAVQLPKAQDLAFATGGPSFVKDSPPK